MYSETTKGIRIEVEPNFVKEESRPNMRYFYFSYRVKITNLGKTTVRLLSRHWVITDGNGEVHEVKGLGVIGHQPTLQPEESYEYSSFCPLPTATGNMRGTYLMSDESKEEYEVKIPLFFLRDLRNFH